VLERQWATVLRVPLADGVAWFKACAPVQAFEPRLTAELHGRWSDRVADVLAFDADRGWLLLADAGTPLQELGNPFDGTTRGSCASATPTSSRGALRSQRALVLAADEFPRVARS